MRDFTSAEIETIAHVAHAANSAFCEVHGDPVISWADGRHSSINSVEFLIANPDAPDSAFHDAWCSQKWADGWTYAPLRDNVLKQHPCLVPFSDLPPHQQAKDRLFQAIVRVLAASADTPGLLS